MIQTQNTDLTESSALPGGITQSFSLVDAALSVTGVGRRILIVDDDESIRKMFAEYLGESFECETAASADEALVQLAAGSFAVVISDVMMPGRNGIELLREVTARYTDTAVIMVSGVDRSQRVRDAMRVGAFDYLIKPCDLDVLTMSVQRAIERGDLLLTARKYKADLERQNAELASGKADLQRLQAQIVHNEKMASLGQLAAGVAHELNNPAGFIYGNMDLLREYLARLEQLLAAYDQASLSADVAQSVDSLKVEIHYDSLLEDLKSIISDCLEGAERIRDIVRNLLLFSRVDHAHVKKIDLHEGLDATIRLLSRYYTASGVVLHRDYGVVPLIGSYGGQLNEVWMNLLANAGQAIGTAGEVCVSTKLEDDWVAVVISDTGCGIPANLISKIFDPFFTTKPVGEGTGLGLSISYGIIERHGGTIAVESVAGAGTTFTVRLPLEPSLHPLEGGQLDPGPSQSSGGYV